MKIHDIRVRTVFDSRANATVEVEIVDEAKNIFRGIVPAGKSTGMNEAHILDPSDAHRVITETVAPMLCGKEVRAVREVDDMLLGLDGTERKENVGGNIFLGVSIAALRGLAFEAKKEPWQVLREEFFPDVTDMRSPSIFANLINGGAHAANNLSIQEYMVIVPTEKSSIRADIEKLIRFYKDLGATLKEENGVPRVAIGDESGYAIDFKDNFAPIQLLERKIEDAGLSGVYRIGLDAAASGFYEDGKYTFDLERITSDELEAKYGEYFHASRSLYTIEDPFEETAHGAFASLQGKHPDKVIVGDDLTTTNARTILGSAKAHEITGVIIKPNQIGTITESCEAIREAHRNGVKTIISHRSGETEDNILIHIAAASNVYGVKIGAPLRERVFKYNELIRIYG